MVEVRACLYFSVIVLCIHVIAGKPIFEFLMCDFLCDDDDVSTSSTTSAEDYDWFSCDDCPRRQRRPTTLAPTTSPMVTAMQQRPPVNLMIPPSNGMNVSLANMDGSWWLNLIPWVAPPATAAATPAADAGGATTAAPATTAAAGATTAAATTAAPAG